MQQFTVPQFIDVEDKILGPITTRQFIIMLVCAVLIAISYTLFDFALFLTVSIILFGLFGIVAFFKINGMGMHYFILNFIQTSKRTKLRVWNNMIGAKLEVEEEVKIPQEVLARPDKVVTASRLTELSLIVDTQGVYRGEGKNIR